MRARGVTFELNARVSAARPGVVVLKRMELEKTDATKKPEPVQLEIPTETLVWAAGAAPNPLVKRVGGRARQTRRRSRREHACGERSHAGFGRSATAPSCPTQRRASRVRRPRNSPSAKRARLPATFVQRSKANRLKPFHFDSLGTLCVVGHHTACAEIKGSNSAAFSPGFFGVRFISASSPDSNARCAWWETGRSSCSSRATSCKRSTSSPPREKSRMRDRALPSYSSARRWRAGRCRFSHFGLTPAGWEWWPSYLARFSVDVSRS